MSDIETNQTPAADINKMPWFLTTRPTTSFLVMAALATGAYIGVNTVTAPSQTALAPDAQLCVKAAADTPVAKCVKFNGPQR